MNPRTVAPSVAETGLAEKTPMTNDRPNRRDVIRQTFGGLAVAAMSSTPTRAREEETPKLLVRGGRPLNAETPVESLGSWITPNDLFFVRSHFGPPAVRRDGRLGVSGLAKTPLDLGESDLAGMEQVTIPAVLQCSGNGRAMFSPRVAGVGWDRGAVGNAEWSGVRLKDLLEKAGIDDEARHVHFLGADGPPNPKTPAFHRSLTIEKAMDPSTLIALKMNGQPLPHLHGGPLRLIVPGWTGNHWIKWLRSITLAADEAPGFYQRTGYRMPKTPVPPGAVIKPEDTVPVTTMNVKSLIVSPAAGGSIKAGEGSIRGVAWTGLGKVAKVEVSIDGGPWSAAEFHGPEAEWAWRQWRFAWTPTPGPHSVRARATDTSGSVQPETTAWNKSGYLWNGIDSVSFEVERS